MSADLEPLTDETSRRDLGTIAADIRAEHEQALTAARTAIEHAVRCGQLLTEAKRQVPHGQWGSWLEANFPASQRTAQGYMKLARAGKTQALAHLGIEQALRAIGTPKPSARDELTTAERDLLVALEEDVQKVLLPGFRSDLLTLYKREAWKQLGYQSWSAFVDAGFPMPPDWDEEIRETMRGLLMEPELTSN